MIQCPNCGNDMTTAPNRTEEVQSENRLGPKILAQYFVCPHCNQPFRITEKLLRKEHKDAEKVEGR